MLPDESAGAQPPQEPTDFEKVIQSLDAQKAQELEQAKQQEQIGAVNGSGEKIVQTLQNNTKELTSSIHDLLLATLVSKDPKITQVAKNLSTLLDAITSATDNVKGANFQPLASGIKDLQTTLKNIPAQIEAAHQSADPTPKLEKIAAVLGAKNWTPNINVRAPAVDLSKLEQVISDLRDTLKKTAAPVIDNSKVEKGLSQVNDTVANVTKAINSLSFPSPNYVLPFKDPSGKAVQAAVDASGNLTVTTSGSTQYDEGATTSPGTGTLSLGRYLTTPPTLTNGQVNAFQLDSAGNLKVTGSLSVGGTTDNSAYTASSSTGTPSMAFYHSTIDTVTDGRAATLAIDSKRNLFTAIRDAAGNARGANVTASNELLVSVNNASIAVTGTVTTTPPANASSNISQINGVTPLMGNGVTGTGSLRVTIASDNTAFAVNSTLSAETTKVIGVVRNSDGAGNLWTSNSTTYTAKFAQDANLLGTLGTAFSTAGKVDVKGADGDVFVRQATAANLNATVVNAAGTALMGKVGIDQTTVGTTNAVSVAQIGANTVLAGNGVSGTGAQRVTIASDSTGQIAPAANATVTGTSIYNNTALSSTKAAVNASAGNMYGYHIYNPNSVVIYIQLFNVASASVTVGSTAPTAVLAVPAFGWADAPPSGPPITFATALTIAATTTATGSGTPTTALLCNIWYK